MDTKFSVALHILTMISESKQVLSSQDLAQSVGTNSSYIRKVIGLLKNAGIINSHQGKSGYELSKSSNEISLLEIYYATQEITHIHLFQFHQNANQSCQLGKNIEKAMLPIFSNIEKQLEDQLANKTLADVIESLYLAVK